MPKKVNILGEKYGRLTVLSEVEPYTSPSGKSKARKFLCQCDCGNQKEIVMRDLRNGSSKSCGCLHKQIVSETNFKHGHSKYKGKRSRTYQIWSTLKDRCKNPNNREYSKYGGRGITYDPAWEDFENFLEDMGEAPPKLSIDRIDNDGNYCKSNCRWTTQKVQANNTRRNKYITYNNKTQTIKQWSEELDMSYNTLRIRLNVLKYSVERAFTQPVIHKPRAN